MHTKDKELYFLRRKEIKWATFPFLNNAGKYQKSMEKVARAVWLLLGQSKAQDYKHKKEEKKIIGLYRITSDSDLDPQKETGG